MSFVETRFRDRLDAAEQLAQALIAHRGRHALVLAIPRGAVPMGRLIADRLEADFDLVLVRKLRSPLSDELAVGAIDASGWAWIAPHAREAGADASWLAREKAEQLALLHRRQTTWMADRSPIDAAGRVAIVVDDGLATGATMIAALHALAARKPSRLICAVPVASPDSLQRVASHADEVVCLYQPAHFDAVGSFYRDFAQVDDAQVTRLMQELPS